MINSHGYHSIMSDMITCRIGDENDPLNYVCSMADAFFFDLCWCLN